MENLPIIRLEVAGMKHQLCVALSAYSAQMDKDLQAAVDDYCTPENINRVVRKTAFDVLDYIIKEEVEKFFRYGEGRNAVAAAVKESILKNKTYSPLDEV